MSASTHEELRGRSCVPCEGGVEKFNPERAQRQIAALRHWSLGDRAESIHRTWRVTDFMAGMRFLAKVAELAEEQGHHPDLHLVGYRNVRIELSTHAIGGLSENDFVLAAKIDEVPVEEK